MNAKDVSEALGDVNEQFIAEAITYKRKRLPFWYPIAAVAACLCLMVGSLPASPDQATLTPTLATPTGISDGYGCASYYVDGVPIQGLIIDGASDTPVVERLEIELNLSGSLLESTPIVSTAALEYTFHNPTEDPISLTLTLPCGTNPSYAGTYQHNTGKELFEVNRHLYTASVNGEDLALTLRYTGSDTPPVEEGQWRIGLFSEQTTVTALTYQVQSLGGADSGYITIWNPGGNESVVLLDGYWSGAIINGNTEKGTVVSPDTTITLYVFGNAEDFNPGWQFYSGHSQTKHIPGTIDLISTEEMTMLDFAAQSWDEASGVSLSDWACTMAEQLHRSTLYNLLSVVPSLEDAACRWFQYELILEPGETVVNSVTMPFYPSLRTNNTEFIVHTDLLSLRMVQPQTGPVITVNTPFEITESSIPFSETGNGYTLDLSEVYKVELSFTLKKQVQEQPMVQPQPEQKPDASASWLAILGITALAGLGLYWLFCRRTE